MMVPYDACYITQEVPEEPALYVYLQSFVCSVYITSLSVFLSEWQLCAAHVVGGQPTEALLPDADDNSCSTFLTLSLLLLLRHGSADRRTGGGRIDAGSHR